MRSRREAFLKQMQDKERAAEARKKARAAANENQKVGGGSKEGNSTAPTVPDKDKSIKNKPTPLAPKVDMAQLQAEPNARKSHDGAAAAQSSGDSISDMINGMPKSGKFTIKKPNVDPTASKGSLLREHLSAPRRASPTEDDYDDFDEIPMITSAPPARPGSSTSATPKPPVPPGLQSNKADIPPPAPPPGMRPPPPPMPGATRTSSSEGGELRGNLKDLGKFLSPSAKKKK